MAARSIAVIGAGPAGAIAVDALVKEQAFDRIRIFERRPVVGGAWFVQRASTESNLSSLTTGYLLLTYLQESHLFVM
jgi:cation diffusion facilitator CzcD-associated flavoprotein CzcO